MLNEVPISGPFAFDESDGHHHWVLRASSSLEKVRLFVNVQVFPCSRSPNSPRTRGGEEDAEAVLAG
jgi:hypothetical protein